MSLQPFRVQQLTIDFLMANDRAFVLNGLGTGKTLTVLWAFDARRKAGTARKMLVVAPLSTLRFVWAKEIAMHLPHLRVEVLHGTKKDRLAALRREADIYIINHDGVKLLMLDLGGRSDIDVLCVDETVAFRTRKAARTKVMGWLAQQKPIVWGLSGAPMPQAPTDVWAQARIINPAACPMTWGEFCNTTMYRIGQFRWVPRPGSVELAYAALRPAVRYRLDEIVELPPVVWRAMRTGDMGAEQRRVYDNLKATAAAMAKGNCITAANAGTVVNKLLQVSCGWVYTDERETVELADCPRPAALCSIIDALDGKAIVFVQYTHALQGVRDKLIQHGVTVETVDGSVPAGARASIFARFQSDDDTFKVLLAQPACMAHGLTLTAASTIVWYGPVTSHDIFVQANARITRIGQGKKQQIILLCDTPAERACYHNMKRRHTMQKLLLSLLEEN